MWVEVEEGGKFDTVSISSKLHRLMVTLGSRERLHPHTNMENSRKNSSAVPLDGLKGRHITENRNKEVPPRRSQCCQVLPILSILDYTLFEFFHCKLVSHFILTYCGIWHDSSKMGRKRGRKC